MSFRRSTDFGQRAARGWAPGSRKIHLGAGSRVIAHWPALARPRFFLGERYCHAPGCRFAVRVAPAAKPGSMAWVWASPGIQGCGWARSVSDRAAPRMKRVVCGLSSRWPADCSARRLSRVSRQVSTPGLGRPEDLALIDAQRLVQLGRRGVPVRRSAASYHRVV